eukprot:1260031-Alexandrium_andersonii.AAC.1
MGAGALEPEPSEFDVDSPELQAAFAVLQRAFRPGKGREKGKAVRCHWQACVSGRRQGHRKRWGVHRPLLEMQRGGAPLCGLPAEG